MMGGGGREYSSFFIARGWKGEANNMALLCPYHFPRREKIIFSMREFFWDLECCSVGSGGIMQTNGKMALLLHTGCPSFLGGLGFEHILLLLFLLLQTVKSSAHHSCPFPPSSSSSLPFVTKKMGAQGPPSPPSSSSCGAEGEEASKN